MKNILLFVALLCQSILFSQSQFKVDFDYAVFQHSDTSGYLEIYYAFFQDQFTQVTGEDNLPVIGGNLHVFLTNADGDTVFIDEDYQFTTIKDTSLESKRGFTGVLNFLLSFNEYRCTLTGSDINSPKSDSTTFNIIVRPPPEERFSISDIELASSINESKNGSGIFYKNTYEVVPNPSNIYGGLMPVVYFYSEIYNIDLDPGSEQLKVDNILYNSANQIQFQRSKLIPRVNASIVEVGTINISKAPSGAYTLVIAVTDTVKNLTVYSSKRLYVHNPGVVDTLSYSRGDIDVLSSEFSIMSEEELDDVFDYSKYIATNKELDQWPKLTSREAKMNFLFNFWKARDENTSTPENEYKREYFNRVKLANEKYGAMQKKGWKSDRGRVLIVYGEPSEIERYPNQTDTRPYEIWTYEQLEGGVIFIFADLSGFGDYRLIHSTARNELRDDFWDRRIKTL
jgi:GWxTD domain-containing protein